MENQKQLFLLSFEDIPLQSFMESIQKYHNLIEAFYLTCGSYPILLILKGTIKDRIAFGRDLGHFKIKKECCSIAVWENKDEIKIDNIHSNILSYLFINARPSSISLDEIKAQIKNIIKISQLENTIFINSIYEIYGNDGWNFCIKIQSTNNEALLQFINQCQQNGLDTSTKIIIKNLKKKDQPLAVKVDAVQTVLPKNIDLKYQILSTLYSNAKEIFLPSKNIQTTQDYFQHQINTLFAKLESPPDKDVVAKFLVQVDPKDNLSKIKKRDLQQHGLHNLIARYGIALHEPGWQRGALLLRARFGFKEKLRSWIKRELLGIYEKYFAKQYFEISGKYSFLVPIAYMDFKVVDRIHEKINIVKNVMGKDESNLIEDFYFVLCRGENQPFEKPEPLDKISKAFLVALNINATNIASFCQGIQPVIVDFIEYVANHLDNDRFIDNFDIEDFFEERNDLSPRSEYFFRQLVKPIKSGHINIESLKKFRADKVNVLPTLDFKNSPDLIKSFIRFEIIESEKEIFTGKIKHFIERQMLINDSWISARNPNVQYNFWIVTSFEHFFSLINTVKPYCTRVAFSFIFSGEFYINGLPASARCRPCLFPKNRVARKIVHAGIEQLNTDKIEAINLHQNECNSCVRFLIPKTKKIVLESDCQVSQPLKEITTAVIGTSITMDNYLNGIIQEKDYKGYKNAMVDFFTYVCKKYKPNIICLPEYHIPLSLFEKIKMLINSGEIKFESGVIAFGSTVHRGYNISPILIRDEGYSEIYWQYKNLMNPMEANIKKGFANTTDFPIMRHTGKGELLLLNTPVGNVAVSICYDMHTLGTKIDLLKKAHFVCVPSFNESPHFCADFPQDAMRTKSCILYANCYSGKKFKGKKIASKIFSPIENNKYPEDYIKHSSKYKLPKNDLSIELTADILKIDYDMLNQLKINTYRH